MYLGILLGVLCLLTITSLVISGICIVYVINMKNLFTGALTQPLISSEEDKEIEELLKDLDIDKINKNVETDFDEEYLNPLQSRGL